MKIIMFKPPADQRILYKLKTITARLWRKAPPREGELVRAQTGRRKDTSFAILRILKVWEWSGEHTEYSNKPKMAQIIAKKEGFANWGEFYTTYYELNAHHWNDPARKHYFISFVNAYNETDNFFNRDSEYEN